MEDSAWVTKEATNVYVSLDSQAKIARTKILANLIHAIMVLRASKKAAISSVLVEEGTQESNAKWLTAVCQILANMAGPVQVKREDLFARVLLSTEEYYAMRESHVTPTLATMEENAFPLPKALSVDVPQDTVVRLAQRKMNVNQILVKMEEDV